MHPRAMNTTSSHSSVASFALLCWMFTFSMIWSSAFVVGKIGLQYTDPYSLLTARFLLASLLLLPLCLGEKQRRAFLDRSLIRDTLILGALNNALYLGLTFSALRFISPELVVVIVSCAPFITTMITGVLRIESVGVRRIFGIVTGFSGVLIITLTRPVGTIDSAGLALAFLGTVSFAVATIYYRNKATLHAPQQVNFWQSIAGAVLLLPLSVTHASSSPLTLHSLPFISAVIYLAVVVTIGGMWMWLFMIRQSGATTASTYHLANPACGLLLSYLVFGTEFRIVDWIGVAIIVMGLLIVTFLPKEKRHGLHS